MSESYNPDFEPTGIEGGVDTNELPWINLPAVPGMSIKPLRASSESGMFSLIVRLDAGTELTHLVHLGSMDLMMLSGKVSYPHPPLKTTITPGIWGYLPANTRIEAMVADETSEFLANYYGPIAFLGNTESEVKTLLTAMDVARLAASHNITLIPNTLAECMQDRPANSPDKGEPLSIAEGNAWQQITDRTSNVAQFTNLVPHFIDTAEVPWIVNPGLPDIALKVLRVSEETGTTSLIVRHNGVAGPHYHLGAADFLVLSGRIGYRAGPPEGYGPGVWFFEPAGARHEATQRIGDDADLIYTANVYGPVQFDEGPGTPIVAVQSWMQYKELADASGISLVANTFDGDTTLLAWAPVGSVPIEA